jgi:hypothetical protein
LQLPAGSEDTGQEQGNAASLLGVRRNYGHLETLVTATATSARDVLLACDQMLEESDEPPEGGEGGGKGGEPNASGTGDLPQAKAQHGVVDTSVDDIGDGACEPPTLIGGGAPGVLCVPRKRQSRGDIMLDVAAGPPELVPVVVAGSAHGALQPTAWA